MNRLVHDAIVGYPDLHDTDTAHVERSVERVGSNETRGKVTLLFQHRRGLESIVSESKMASASTNHTRPIALIVIKQVPTRCTARWRHNKIHVLDYLSRHSYIARVLNPFQCSHQLLIRYRTRSDKFPLHSPHPRAQVHLVWGVQADTNIDGQILSLRSSFLEHCTVVHCSYS